jgi:hypothetical protein
LVVNRLGRELATNEFSCVKEGLCVCDGGFALGEKFAVGEVLNAVRMLLFMNWLWVYELFIACELVELTDEEKGYSNDCAVWKDSGTKLFWGTSCPGMTMG